MLVGATIALIAPGRFPALAHLSAGGSLMSSEPFAKASLGPLVLRLALAVIFIYHGFVKVTGKDNTWGASWATEAWNQQSQPPPDVTAKLDKLKEKEGKSEAEKEQIEKV